MRVLLIARASIRRVMRDRTALFFLLVLPVLVIIIVGATVRGFSTFRVGVVNADQGPAGREIVAALSRAPGIAVTTYTTVHQLTTGVALGELNTGVYVPKGLDAAQRSGAPVHVDVYAEQANSNQQAAATAVASVILERGSIVQAATFATAHGSGTYEANLLRAAQLQRQVPRVGFKVVQAQSKASVLPQGYSYSAPTELVLFVFLSALTAGAAIIETRRLSMYERMRAAPVRARTIIAGETMTYVAIALLQSVTIVLVGAVLFGVSWGNPLAAAALILIWSVVGAGAGMLAGTLFRTPEQASSVGPTVGLAFAMLGGCMWPLAIVSSTMRTVGHLVPQAWAVDAWTSLLARHGTILTISPQLGMLCAFAALFLVLATSRLRRLIS